MRRTRKRSAEPTKAKERDVSLTLHFLNVGHGDCTFVEFDSGRLMMVDINNSTSLPGQDQVAMAESKGMSLQRFLTAELGKRSWEEYYESLLVDPYDYYREHFDGRPVFRYVQTHPDMDHMSGLHRFFWQEKVPLENFWDISHSKEMAEGAFDTGPHAEVDWLVYQLLRDGRGPENSTHKVIHNLRGAGGHYWDDDNLAVLSPSAALVDYCNSTTATWNNASHVLRIAHAGRTVILGGDAETLAWDEIIDEFSPSALDCDVLKASHHGRLNGYVEEAAEAMNPRLVICSVGNKPTTDASSKYKASGASVLSTRYNGTIRVEILNSGAIVVENADGASLWQEAG
jgi:competence protein ComEC